MTKIKELFPGYIPRSEKELGELFETSIFSLDANILLNLYRYSDDTLKQWLDLLNEIKDRIWFPHQVVSEFFENRAKVISDQTKSYSETTKLIDQISEQLKGTRHPYVKEKSLKSAISSLDNLKNELQKNEANHVKKLTSDPIQSKLISIIGNNIGDPYSEEELEEIITDGEKRYEEKFPPGFKDSKKGDSSQAKNFSGMSTQARSRPFGDFIVWRQIIDKAIESQSNIILITDDKKEDWWHRVEGKTLGPRPELRQEFYKLTNGKQFHMYNSVSFLEQAGKKLKLKLSSETVAEVKNVKSLKVDPLIGKWYAEKTPDYTNPYLTSKFDDWLSERHVLGESHSDDTISARFKDIYSYYYDDKKSETLKSIGRVLDAAKTARLSSLSDSELESLARINLLIHDRNKKDES